MRRYTVAVLMMPLAACGTAPNDPGVGGVTRSEANALNDAAQMLDQNVPPISLTDGEAAAAQTPPQTPVPPKP